MTVFKDKVCVVTGAASGIGRAMALQLAQAGAMLALSDIDGDGLEETKALIGASNRVTSDVFDMTDPDAIAAYPETVRSALGPADFVFNVAGLTRVSSFEEMSMTAFEKVMDVNFYGVVRMAKGFLPQLLDTGGVLVNISSLFGLIGYPGQTHYCASKFAVRGFSETLAAELSDKGVCVTSVHPGGVATNIVNNATIDALPEGVASHDQMKANFDKAAITTPERAAEIILNGAANRRRRVVVGRDAKMISFVQRMLPGSYAKVLTKFLSRAQSDPAS